MKAFIFDMDGTLVDNMSWHLAAWQKMAAELGLGLKDWFFLKKCGGLTNGDIFRSGFGLQFDDQQVRQHSERKEALYREIYASHIQPIAGLLSFLQRAQAARIPIALGTSAGMENVNFVLDTLKIRGYFQAIASEQDAKRGKPDPTLFLTAAQRLHVAPTDCLVFEDALAGVEAARRAGMDVVFLTTTCVASDVAGLSNVLKVVADYQKLDPLALAKNDAVLAQ